VNFLAILPTLTFTNTQNPLPHCTTVHRCLGCFLLMGIAKLLNSNNMENFLV
jgi:hypothetical protein